MNISPAQAKALKSVTPEGFMTASAATLNALRDRGLIRLESARLGGPGGTPFSAVRITPAGQAALANADQ